MRNNTLILIGGGLVLAYLTKRNVLSSLEGLGEDGKLILLPSSPTANVTPSSPWNPVSSTQVVSSYEVNGFNIYATNGAGPWIVRWRTGNKRDKWKVIGSYATQDEANNAAMAADSSIGAQRTIQQPTALPSVVSTSITPNTYPSSLSVSPSYQPSVSMVTPSKAPLIAAGFAAITVPLIAYLALRG